MEGIRNRVQGVPIESDSAAPSFDADVTLRRNSHAETAIQYLTWALEAIEKAGSREAAEHTRNAITALQKKKPRKTDKG